MFEHINSFSSCNAIPIGKHIGSSFSGGNVNSDNKNDGGDNDIPISRNTEHTKQKVHTMIHLKIYIDPTETDLLHLYEKAVVKHNQEVVNNPFPNAGFDLFVPNNAISTQGNTYWIDHKIKAAMTECVLCPRQQGLATTVSAPTTMEWKKIGRGYCMYPRSSLSKTPLMLANHVGIIDSGYGGNLIGALRHISPNPESFVIEKDSRLLQICHPGLLPFTVEIVKSEEDLFLGGGKTQRGDGGFGSTGV